MSFSDPAVIGSPAALQVSRWTVVMATTWEFGYQAIAGLRYNINPALAFDLDYRYLATAGPDASVEGNRGVVSTTDGSASNSVVASLSLRFGAPPPAPSPRRRRRRRRRSMRKVFLVFFDWDKATITPEGMQIIQQAANAFQAGAPVTIQVTGYTDRSGSPGYNQRLSERRANNVADALVRLGVPRAADGGQRPRRERQPRADRRRRARAAEPPRRDRLPVGDR